LKKKYKSLDRSVDNKIIIYSKYLEYWCWLYCFILIVYGQTINFDFVYLDDDKIIIDHQDKISSLSKLTEAFRSEYGFDQGTPFYRPIVITSFIIDANSQKQTRLFIIWQILSSIH